jgi:hypothetical protein
MDIAKELAKEYHSLPGAVACLASYRSIEAEYRDEIAQIEAEIAETPAGKRLARARDLLKVAQGDVADVDKDVRVLALNAYAINNDRYPHPAIEIKMVTAIAYDESQAINYCREHLPKALKLDKRQFEKVAKVAEPDFVTVKQEPKAYIASDLRTYLSAAPDAAISAQIAEEQRINELEMWGPGGRPKGSFA